MADIKNSKWLPHAIIMAGFAVISLLFCYPALQGKVLYQSDNVSWKGMSHEAKQWHDKTGENTLWSNSQFGGMPTYTFYVPETNNFLGPVYQVITSLLPKPANFFFLAMLCFYVLMCTLRINRWLGGIGALAFAFATYNPIIIAVGHETKMLAIAFMPLVLSGLIILFRGKYISGAALTALGFALLCTTGHYQVVYYVGIIILMACLFMFIRCMMNGKAAQGLIAGVISVISLGLGVGTIMAVFLPTQEYTKETMRGGGSQITFLNHDKGKSNGGLDKEYAFRWSNGIGETFSGLVPFLYGGSSGEPAAKMPSTDDALGGQYEKLPGYWGPQPGISGPVYFGAVICFLFLLGLLIVRSPHKWWILAACLIGIMMSWGKNLPGFNYWLFDHLPYFNKFRTPSMILVIPQFLFPVLGIWAVNDILKGKVSKETIARNILIAAGITGGLALLLGVGGGIFFDFASDADKAAKYPAQIMDALKEDRAAMARNSGLLSFFYIAVAAGLLWMFVKDKMKQTALIAGLGIIVALDLLPVAAHYLPASTDEYYKDESDYDAELQPRPVDQQILIDHDPYFRVFDISKDPYNDATQAYFHKCIGGYSPAKMEIYQDLIEVHLSKGFNGSVLDMLNTKYIIVSQGGQTGAIPNPTACGNAWFVDEVKMVNSADEEILALKGQNLGDTAVVANPFQPKHTAIVRNDFANDLSGYTVGKDSAAKIQLTKYGLNTLAFASSNTQNGLGVFSDIYYPHGWHAFIDGKEAKIIRVNYLLRGLKIPAGTHKIEFRFTPESFAKGNKYSMISSLALIVLCLAALVFIYRKKKDSDAVVMNDEV